MRSASGQGTVEYVVVVLLISLVMALGALAVAAPGIVNGVVNGIRRALCIVSGGGCVTVAARPCLVASSADDERVVVHVGLVRLGDHAGLLRETRSDGTVVVSLIDDWDAGAQLGIGVQAHVDVDGKREGGGEAGSVAAMAELAVRRSWYLPNAQAADRLVERLQGPTGVKLIDRPVEAVEDLLGLDDDQDHPPPPDEVSFSAGAKGLAEAHLSGAVADLDLDVVRTLSAGGRTNRHTGERTVFLQANDAASAQLARSIFKARLRVVDQMGLALVFGRDGQPRELVATAAGEVDRGLLAALPVKGLRFERRAGDRAELDVRLDLTQADNLAVATGALRALAHHPLDVGAAQAGVALGALVQRMEEDGRLDARLYASDHSEAGGDADAALGGRVGGGAHVSHDELSLRSAWSRPPGGLWDERVDCERDVARA